MRKDATCLPDFFRLELHVLCANALIALLVASFGAAIAHDRYGSPPPNLNAYLDKLVSSYPDWVVRYDNRFLVLKTGATFEISDHRANKSFEELLEKPDMDHVLRSVFLRNNSQTAPKNFDPGRVRFEPLLLAMYGDCKNNKLFPSCERSNGYLGMAAHRWQSQQSTELIIPILRK